MKNAVKIINEKETTLKDFLASVCADIDIFLLQDESKENDLDKMYSKEEIREQLYKTMWKFTRLPNIHLSVWNVPLFPALTKVALLDMEFSKSEIDSIEKQIESEKKTIKQLKKKKKKKNKTIKKEK
jgi:hypothetical protein